MRYTWNVISQFTFVYLYIYGELERCFENEQLVIQVCHTFKEIFFCLLHMSFCLLFFELN